MRRARRARYLRRERDVATRRAAHDRLRNVRHCASGAPLNRRGDQGPKDVA